MREEQPFSKGFFIYTLIRKLGTSTFSSYNKSKGRRGFDMGNLLSEVHPELIEQWSERNLPLTPDKITYGSNKIVWWKGACGHEWQTSIKARSNGENCPICSGARVVGSPNLKVLTHISKASIIKCLTNKRHFLSEDKSFYTIYTNLYSNPPKNSTNL